MGQWDHRSVGRGIIEHTHKLSKMGQKDNRTGGQRDNGLKGQ
jgi:hypothetical protein